MKIEEIPKAYTASQHETQIYEMWESSGAFAPTADLSKPAFSIIMPPPNANGNLHAGHALDMTLQDIMIRYHRMKGDRTIWVPGSDHAGIETQVVFEKKLEKEGRSRFQMTREQFYQEVLEFTLENKKNMERQVRALGASCDWTAERFTLDPEVVERVYQNFKKMYDQGLIYRGERIVNYSVKYQTAYSDIEIVYEDRIDPLYYIKYGPLVIATVRPETKFGDTAVAVHPDDPRYQKYIGTEIEVTLATGEKRIVPVIADEYVDPKFGTGVVKITPAHDPNDFEVGKRHNLPIIEVINKQGRLTEVAGEFAGLKVKEARIRVAERLQEMGLIEKIDHNYSHRVALCYKSNTEIEPLIMPQWFVKVGELTKPAIEAIENDKIKFYPDSYKKITLDWLKNLKDWNISRQIWWGIPISEALPAVKQVAEDPDTFDTWFSSSQWPYITMQALNGREGRDYLKEFYPTSVLSTARDIIFAWVSRMIMMGLYTQNEVPFQAVYLHGMVLDPKGQKMSKSKGNVVNPLDLCAKYGTDAVRFGLTIGTSAGQNIPLPEEKMVGGRNFANKLWNISRFIMMSLGEALPSSLPKPKAITEADKVILEGLQKMVKETGEHIEKFRFSLALQNLQDFVWHSLADQYLEAAKNQPSPNTQAILMETLTTSLKLLHPFIPFVTETIFQNLPEAEGLLMQAAWPVD